MRIDPDLAVIQLAEPQHGAFSREQAKACGHSRRMIQYRVQNGRWELLHPDTYAVAGTPSSWERDESAACLWAEGAAAGLAAGRLHELPGCGQAPVEIVTTHRHKVMPLCGIVVHLTKRLPSDQVVVIDGIPTTSIDRTLLDLCGRMPRRRAAIALDNALFRGLTTVGGLDYCLFRTARRGRNGCGVLRELVKERWNIGVPPNSPLETVIFEMIVQGALPMPELQYEIRDPSGAFVARPDFVYPDEKLIIEGHSRLWHEGVESERHDLERHEALVALGYRILYVMWADATRYAEQTVARIRSMLGESALLRV